MGMSLSGESENQTTVFGKKNGSTALIVPSKQGLAGAIARIISPMSKMRVTRFRPMATTCRVISVRAGASVLVTKSVIKPYSVP